MTYLAFLRFRDAVLQRFYRWSAARAARPVKAEPERIARTSRQDPRLPWWRRWLRSYRELRCKRLLDETRTPEDLAKAIEATDYAKQLAQDSGDFLLADRLWRRARQLEEVGRRREYERQIRERRQDYEDDYLVEPCERLIRQAKAAEGEAAVVLLMQARRLAERAENPELKRAVSMALTDARLQGVRTC